MQSRLRHYLSALALLLLVAACADAPTSPTATVGVGPREGVWIPPEPGECDPYQDVNWCEDDPDDGTCATSDSIGGPEGYVGIQACPSPRGGGGSSSPPPTYPDTCKTGNAVIDDPAVEAGLTDLWKKSNIDSAQEKRLEHAAWIIRNADGSHRLMAFTYTIQTPCSVNGNMNAPPSAVGWAHTHPFRSGETMQVCGALKREVSPGQWVDWIGPNGQPIYPRYSNQPSQPDRDFMGSVNSLRKQLGQTYLNGYVIDNERITRYGANGAKDQSYGRCGY